MKRQHDRKRTLFLIRMTYVVVILLCAFGETTFAQESSILERLTGMESQRVRPAASTVQPTGVALESTVDPEKYFVGPSDVIAVNIWISPPINLALTVTPEGTLIIPTVGEISVSDLLLANAKEKVLAEVRKKYITGQASVTLLRPRPIIISVLGNVLNPGLYTLSAVDRANKAIEEANRPTAKQSPSDALRLASEMSTRNIVMKHKDGTQERIDITKFLATKEDRWNPYLREGDILIIPRRNPTKNVFGIYGEVNAPGRYEFVRGDSVLDVLRIGQGFTRLALTDSVEFSRLNSDGTQLSTRVINLQAIKDGLAPNIVLEPGDRIIVKASSDQREDYRVHVEGEVLYPGIYPITKNQTKLSEVIRRAGGFTEFAWLEGADLNRRSIRMDEVELERLINLRGGASPEDSAYYLLETELRLRKEIVNVDFVRLFARGDTTQDVTVQSEDHIFVPTRKRTIYVFGQVVTAGHVPYKAGEGIDYYILKAGGLTERARSSDLKIVKARTRQWLAPNETIVEEGDHIWVPKDPEHSFAYYMTVASQAASVLSVVLGMAFLVVQATK